MFIERNDDMPKIFLSPSTQDYNQYYDGSGSEEYYMNQIADYMEPYLTASGIQFTRNDPSGSVNQSVALSNQGSYDLHLALHSNAAGAANAGRQQGTDVYYYETSAKGKNAAEIFADNLRDIYPYPDRVKTIGNTSLAELRRTTAPAILIEIAYHDNPEDAEWIKNNLRQIAYNLSLSTAEYLGVPFTEPSQLREGSVNTGGSNLNIRSLPNETSAVIGKIPDGALVTITGEEGDWYVVQYNGVTGYAKKNFITIE